MRHALSGALIGLVNYLHSRASCRPLNRPVWMQLLIHRWSSLVPSCIPPYVCGDWCELDDIPKQPFLPATTELVPGRSLRSCCVAFFILTWVAPLFLLGSWPRHLVFLIATTGFVSETLYATSHRVGLWTGSVKGEGVQGCESQHESSPVLPIRAQLVASWPPMPDCPLGWTLTTGARPTNRTGPRILSNPWPGR